MEIITKNVRDISLSDKLALEHVIGQQLAENQQVTIQICNLDFRSAPEVTENEPSPALPSWCDVYAGLTDEQVNAIEQTASQRANLTQDRPSRP